MSRRSAQEKSSSWGSRRSAVQRLSVGSGPLPSGWLEEEERVPEYLEARGGEWECGGASECVEVFKGKGLGRPGLAV